MTDRMRHKTEVVNAVRHFMHSLYRDNSAENSFLPVVNITSQLPLTYLDQWEQLLRWEILPIDRTKRPTLWARLAGSTSTQVDRSITWLDLCNGDGFVRERALLELKGNPPNAFFFALVLRRLNDWVPQVRDAARRQLPSMVDTMPPKQVADVLCAVLPHWQSWGRMTDLDKDVLLKIASIKPIADLIKSRILSEPSGPFPKILVQVGRSNVLDPSLQEIAKHAVQPAVRARAYRALFSGKMSWLVGYRWVWVDKRWGKKKGVPFFDERTLSVDVSFLESVKLAIGDPSPMVRRVAGEALIKERQSLGLELVDLATMLASDTNPSVAENGQFILDKLRDET